MAIQWHHPLAPFLRSVPFLQSPRMTPSDPALTAFGASVSAITLAELGDKTFSWP